MCSSSPIDWLSVATAVGAHVGTLSRARVTFRSAVLASKHVVDEAPDFATEILVEEACPFLAIDIETRVNDLAGRAAMELIGDVVAAQRDLHVVVVVLAAREVDANEVAQVAELLVGGFDDVAVCIVRGEVGCNVVSISLRRNGSDVYP
jgi:hypothetical protein